MSSEEEKEEGNITLVKFTSKLGNSIVHPEHWTTNDKGDAFSVAAPNGQAIINVLTFAVEGTGELSDLQRLMVDYVKGEWIKSGWTEIEIGGMAGAKLELEPKLEETDTSWRLYALRNGHCYHAIFLNGLTLVLTLNGGFYEGVIESFEGISGVD